jgi:hypothetical protein
MPVILVKRMMDPKIIIGKNGGQRKRRGTRGRCKKEYQAKASFAPVNIYALDTLQLPLHTDLMLWHTYVPTRVMSLFTPSIK